MEENKKLYPFKFIPIEDEYPWGKEVFGLADLGYRDTQILNGWLSCNSINEVMDMYVDRVVGENVFEFFGRQFPVGVKYIDAVGRMPLIVHPDDEVAGQRYDFLGKTKLWYVLDAKPGARVCIGVKEETSVADFYSACVDGSAEALLKAFEPKAGDFFVIEPGVPHCAAGGVKILEIGEASPLDFCLTNWGEEVPENEFDSSLNIVEALDFIVLKPCGQYVAPEQKNRLVSRQEFVVTRLELPDPVHIIGNEATSFAVYNCVSGEASVQFKAENGEVESVIVAQGDTVMVPAEVDDFIIVPRQSGTVLLETMVERKPEEDGYIDPEAEPQLPGEGEEFKFNPVYGRFSKN